MFSILIHEAQVRLDGADDDSKFFKKHFSTAHKIHCIRGTPVVVLTLRSRNKIFNLSLFFGFFYFSDRIPLQISNVLVFLQFRRTNHIRTTLNICEKAFEILLQTGLGNFSGTYNELQDANTSSNLDQLVNS